MEMMGMTVFMEVLEQILFMAMAIMTPFLEVMG